MYFCLMRAILFFLSMFPLLCLSQSEVRLEYWNNGNVLSQVHYVDGLRDGSSRSYHKNGFLMDEVFYLKGKMTGISMSYYDNGQIRQQGKYDDRNNGVYSRKLGKWLSYNKQGQLISESTFILGVENRKYFNSDGSIQSKLLNGC